MIVQFDLNPRAAGSLDYLIRSLQQRRRNRQAEDLGGLEFDH
jgi:hypothetical protein